MLNYTDREKMAEPVMKTKNRRKRRRDLSGVRGITGAADFNGGFMMSGEDGIANPMDSLGNLTDVMLVFACGLMVALIMNLNVDMSRLDEAVIRYEDKSKNVNVENVEGSGMQEIGKVYKDPKTGKTYIVDQKAEKKKNNK